MGLGSVVVVPCADIVQGKSQSDCGTVAPNTTRAWARPRIHANAEISRFVPPLNPRKDAFLPLVRRKRGDLPALAGAHNDETPRHEDAGLAGRRIRKPSSVPAARCRTARSDHSSRTRVAARLERRTRRLGRTTLERLPISPCSGWGLPCDRRYRRPGELLPRRFTLTERPAERWLAPAPREMARRFVFCCTVLGVTPTSR